MIPFDSDRQGAERKLHELAQSAASNGLSFQVALGKREVGQQSIEEAVVALSKTMAGKKRRNKRPKSSVG